MGENVKQKKRYRRHKRVRAKIKGTKKIPRLYVFRSNKHIYTQLIDDENGQTLLSASDLELKDKKKIPPKEIAFQVGRLLAEKSLAQKIDKCVFDRGGYKYHGRIKAVAEGAREGGLKF